VDSRLAASHLHVHLHGIHGPFPHSLRDCSVGSMEHAAILVEGLSLVLLGSLALLKRRKGIVATLGLLWIGLALFDFSLLLFPGWETWRDMGSYWIFITAMLWIRVKSRHGTPAKTLSANPT